MMREKWFLLFCLIAILEALGRVSAQAQAPAAPTAVGTPGLEKAIATIHVDDLPEFINGISAVTTKIQPTLTAEALRTMIGNQFGDQQFQGFAPGSGIAVVVLPPNTILTFAQIVPAQREAYLQAVKLMNPGSTLAEDLLVIVSDPTMTQLATQLAPEVKSRFFSGKAEPFLTISLNTQTAASLFEPMRQGLMQSVLAVQQQQAAATGIAVPPEGMKARQQILEAELRIFVSLLKQLKTIDLIVLPMEDNLAGALRFSTLLDTNLDKLFGAPGARENIGSLMQILPGKGAFRMVAVTDGAAMRRFIEAEANTVLVQMQLSEEAKKSVLDMIEMSVGAYGNGFAMDLFLPDAPLMSGTMIYDMEDPQKGISILQAAPEKMQGFLKMYEQMGMPMKVNFQKNVRQYKNLPIHRFDLNLPATGVPAEARKMMEAMLGNPLGYDLAVVEKKIVYTMGGEKIEEMIDALQAGKHPTAKPFQGEKMFGKNNRQLYAELDLGLLVKSASGIIQKMAPPNTNNSQIITQMESALANADPIIFGGSSLRTQGMLEFIIPRTTLAGLAQVGTMVTQQIQMPRQQATASAATSTPGNIPAAQPGTPATPTAAKPAEKVDPFAQSEKDLRNIAIALESYRMDNKRYPESLDQLSQKVTYFKVIPGDPFSPQGAPYHYTVSDNGARWTLWSVGPDGTDDGSQVVYNPTQGPTAKGDIVHLSPRSR